MLLLQMTVSASVLIAALALVRGALLHRLPKGLLSALWLLPLARLLLPFFPAASFSLAALLGLGGPLASPGGLSWPLMPSRLTPPPALSPEGVPPAGLPLPAPSPTVLGEAAPALTWLWSALVALWAAGAILLAVMILGRHLMLRRDYRDALPVRHPAVVRWQRENPLGRRVAVRQSSRIQSPLTYGVWRPVILLPASFDLSKEPKLWCVLIHEYHHILRWDTLTKWLLAAALCLHWFNPLVWWMYRKAGLDMELACDAGVLRTLGQGAKALYATLLLEMEQEKTAALSLASSFRPTATEERMLAMLRQKKLRPAVGVFVLALLAVVTAMVATRAPDPVLREPAPVTVPQEESKQEEPAVQEEELSAQEEEPTAQEEPAAPSKEPTPAPPLYEFTPEEEALVEQFVTRGEALPKLPSGRELLYKLAAGTQVPAPVAGEVKYVYDWNQWPFGRQVIILTDDGATLVVGHLSSVLVEVGDRVEASDPIGEAGTSGNVTGPSYGIYLRRNPNI